MTSAIEPEDERRLPVHAALVGAGASSRMLGVQRWIHIAIVALASSGCGTLPSGRLPGTLTPALAAAIPSRPLTAPRMLRHLGYVIEIQPPFDNFPSDDAIADTWRFHELIEAHVRGHPEQYRWACKRLRRDGFDPYTCESAPVSTRGRQGARTSE